MSRDAQDGFTLIEALVAMAVLALGAVSLLSATEGHAARISAVTDRTVARWAADHALTAARLGLPPQAEVRMLNRDLHVTLTVTPLEDTTLESVDVTVFAQGSGMGDSDGASLYRSTGYRVTGDSE